MQKLNIIVISEKCEKSLERFLASIKTQDTDELKTTVVTSEADKTEKLKDKYIFDVVKNDSCSAVQAVNQLMSASDSEYIAVMYCDQIVDFDFFEAFDEESKSSDFILFNFSRKHHGWNFINVYPGRPLTVEECLHIRPSVFCCVFKADIVKNNKLYLKSFKAADQLEFIEACCSKSVNPVYVPDIHIYMDEISDSTQFSFDGAFTNGKYSESLKNAAFADMKAIIAKSGPYKAMGRLKRFYIKNKDRSKRLLKKYSKKIFRG